MSEFITRKYVDAKLALAEAQTDETGASAAEYGILIAGIAVVIVAATFALGGRISDLFDGVTLAP